MTDIIQNFCAKLKAKRGSKGLTQAQVATAAGISEMTYRRIESGNCNLTLRVLLGLCSALGTRPSELLP